FAILGAAALTAAGYIGKLIDQNLDQIAGRWATAIGKAADAAEAFAAKAWKHIGEVAGGERPVERAGLVGAAGFAAGRKLLGLGARGAGLLGAGMAGFD